MEKPMASIPATRVGDEEVLAIGPPALFHHDSKRLPEAIKSC